MDSTLSYRPTDRSLPATDVNAETITDAYVAFILYCNPHFDLDIDTSTLRSQFNTPPRSDNKEFEIYALWELIIKFDAKEIKTWGQLAQDLGVEPPDVSKGQSVQKVQQYTVRLKRWMRAMHVDAFFEYLLGKQHAYFLDVPHPSSPYPAAGRDGVAAEEDTAIRALDPSFKPKRGRRRNSETEQDAEAHEPMKHPRLLGAFAADGQSQSAYPRSAAPMSAHPDGRQNDPWTAAPGVSQHFAPWSSTQLAPQSAMTPSAPQHLRWQTPGGPSLTPATPHPLTALPGGSMASHIDAAFADEPKSAITPSTKRKRRHGPAVSSAWPSQNPPGTKPRGRPPASRTTQDGPFSTFPSNPATERSSTPQDGTSIAPDATPPDMPLPQSASSSRPGRLSLQVPQHTGGPVRLATPPPPRVVVSGEANVSESDDRSVNHTPDTGLRAAAHGMAALSNTQPIENIPIPSLTFETLKRALTTNLLRAELMGRKARLTGDRAKRLADAVLDRLSIRQTPSPDQGRDTVALLTAASWLGLGDQLHIPLGPAIGHAKKINLTLFRADSEGYEEIVSGENSWPDGEQLREVYDLFWTSTQGSCTGSFALNSLTLAPADEHRPERSADPDIHDAVLRVVSDVARRISNPPDGEVFRQRAKASGSKAVLQHEGRGGDGLGDDGVDWKKRAMALEFGGRIAQGEMFRYKERLMEQILDVLL
ncbi:hypothetical protein Q7P37_010460 [Cladosporium fusiforme]